MIDQPGSPQRAGGRVRSGGTLRGSAVALAGIAVAVLIGALAFRELGDSGARPPASPSPGASALGSPGPSAELSAEPSAQPTPPPPTPSQPAELTPLPSIVISGELPPPDATPNPAYRVISGLSFWDVVATAASLGLACESERNPSPHAYYLVCEGQDAGANVEYSLLGDYWSFDAIMNVSLHVRPLDSTRPMSDPNAAPRAVLPLASLVGDDARAWAQVNLDNSICGAHECKQSFDGFDLWMQVGSKGARALGIYGDLP